MFVVGAGIISTYPGSLRAEPQEFVPINFFNQPRRQGDLRGGIMVIYYLTHWEHPGVVQEHVKSRGGDLKNNPFCSPGLGEEWGVVDVGGTLLL